MQRAMRGSNAHAHVLRAFTQRDYASARDVADMPAMLAAATPLSRHELLYAIAIFSCRHADYFAVYGHYFFNDAAITPPLMLFFFCHAVFAFDAIDAAMPPLSYCHFAIVFIHILLLLAAVISLSPRDIFFFRRCFRSDGEPPRHPSMPSPTLSGMFLLRFISTVAL